MELIDTPNPNAKKIITEAQEHDVREDLYNIEGVFCFFWSQFYNHHERRNTEWGSINQDIINIFDRL